MRVLLLAAVLLMFTLPAEAGGPSSGVYAGKIDEGMTRELSYSTHGDNPCLSIYIPHTYTVTVTTAPTAVLRASVGDDGATTKNGVATFSFTANYCTAFTVVLEAVSTDGAVPYGVTVTHVNQLPRLG